jgi:transposase InsO family protein
MSLHQAGSSEEIVYTSHRAIASPSALAPRSVANPACAWPRHGRCGPAVNRKQGIWNHVTSINQLWVADITYIRLQWEFVYLAVVLDAFSRRCLGWALQRSLESALVLEALSMALMRRRPRPGLVHHSDRGVQYASRDYTTQLEQHGIRISMSRLATPYDNARAESFMKTLKYEEVYRTEYRDLEEAKALIKQFLEKVYNQQRLHSALGYRPPLEFERSLRPLRAMGKRRA